VIHLKAASRMCFVVVLWCSLMLAAKNTSNSCYDTNEAPQPTLSAGATAPNTAEAPATKAENITPTDSASKGVLVYITVDGERRAVHLSGETVMDALEACGVVLAPHDRVKPPTKTKLKDGMEIVVERVQITEERCWEWLKPTTLFKFDSSLPKGTTKVLDVGRFGLAELLVRVYRKDGKVTLRKVLSRNIIAQPKPSLVAVGVGRTPTQLAYRGTLPSRGMPVGFKVLTMIATGYDPGPRSCGRYANGLTATGVRARRGVVAVDPRVIKLGTRLYVEGYGYAIAADTGGAIKGNRIDLCFDTYEEAIRWGMRKVRVLILSTPDGTDAEDLFRMYREGLK
jgi:3D (Asp-Asp-Asp) domain-containing protein